MKIEFYPSSTEVELIVPAPKPAAHYIPEWYKKVPKFSDKNLEVSLGKLKGPGIKSCMPFLDGMINGYIQETWQDLIVDYRNGSLNVNFPTDPPLADSRGDNYHSPIGKDFYPNEFVWRVPWMPRLPKGYSMLFVSPINHVELPFQTASGIMDSDVFYHIPFGNFPFYIKSGFTGLIPAGTPMYQMIPIKRETWTGHPQKFSAPEQLKREYVVRRKSFGSYKDIFHVKKLFS